MKPIKVGLLGFGTVGGGTFAVLARNQEEISRRAGRRIEIAAVCRRDLAAARSVVGEGVKVVADPMAIVNDPEIDIVVELIGGEGVAREVVMADYLLSNTYYAPGAGMKASDATSVFARMPADVQQVFMGVEAGFLEAFLAGIEARYGSVEAYLAQELGVGPAELDLLRARYTM